MIPETEKNLLKTQEAILNFNHIQMTELLPVEGEKVSWARGEVLRWQAASNLQFRLPDTSVLYLATYLETFRWLQTQLLIHTADQDLPISVYLDGQVIKTNKLKDKIIADFELLNKKHILILKVILPRAQEITLKAVLKNNEPFKKNKVHISLDPFQRVSEENILNTVDVKQISVSANGKLAAITLEQIQNENSSKKWLEILDTRSGKILFSSQNFGSISGYEWLKDSLSFSYTRTEKDMTSVYTYNLGSHTQKCILDKVKDFSSYWWAEDNSFLIYSIFHEKKKELGYKYIKEISDKSTYSRFLHSMYIYLPAGGVTHKVADQIQDFNEALISPDRQKVLFIKNEADDQNRPYNKKLVYLFDISTYKLEKLLESNWINDCIWSPDSEKILMLGGPSSFGGIGKNLEEGKIPNDYDIQAYIYDLNNPRRVEPISKDFNPSIDSASWYSADHIYFKVTDKADVNIYEYSIRKRNYRKLDTKVDAISRIDFARKRNIAVYWGSCANVPHKLYTLNLATGSASLLKDYNKESFRYVKIGKVVPWNFKTKEGSTIIGRIHYPLDFDKNKKYPGIVYYYGGVGPVERSFGGRYPFNWYTAQGYIVYVLQPSGSVGFGQDFSARHVNDWGKITSAEVIAGVKELLKAHPYIDPERLGAMGASYGGFLTQYLATCTDMFAAFISHAGISSLSSYWGSGDWGYTYSGFATADSFPWNRKDIYVGHSPLFMADRITRPILLLHGAVDNNVPPGESYQMFTALKLLGKEVALVTFDNMAHWILEYQKRLHWMHTIIAWFDKYLKKQPEHWDNMYPN